MKNFSAIFFPFLLLLLLTCGGCKPANLVPGTAQSLADSIIKSLVPDRRVALCDIRLKNMPGNALILIGETSVPELKKALISALGKVTNNLTDSIIILPDTIRNKKYFGLVTLSVINIRKDHEHEAEMVTQALMGTPVRIIREEEGWLLIQTPDAYLGWTTSGSVAAFDAQGMKEWKGSDRLIYLNNYGNILAQPSQGPGISDIVAGCIVVRTGEQRGYAEVRLPDGRKGYLADGSYSVFDTWKNEVTCTENSVVETAFRFCGVPYLWGGTSMKAVDCSGLSKSVYFLNGLILSRDASQQALYGTEIDLSGAYKQFRPGDLLFFGVNRNGKPRISHVAVYRGDSEFVHASGAGLVKVNSLDPTRSNYHRFSEVTLLRVRRIIGSEHGAGIVRISEHPWY